jgi:hypothetical protein
MKWNKQFEYPKSMRSLINDERHYEVGTEKLPSVTTILEQLQQSDEKRESLAKQVESKSWCMLKRIELRTLLQHVELLCTRIPRTPFKRSRATRFERRGASGEKHGTNYNRQRIRGSYKKFGAMKLYYIIRICMQGKQIYVACIKEETVLLTLNRVIGQNKTLG